HPALHPGWWRWRRRRGGRWRRTHHVAATAPRALVIAPARDVDVVRRKVRQRHREFAGPRIVGGWLVALPFPELRVEPVVVVELADVGIECDEIQRAGSGDRHHEGLVIR